MAYLRCLALSLVIASAIWTAWQAALKPPGFVCAATSSSSGQPHWETHLIPRPADTPQVHCATLASLPDGDRLAIWYGGQRECAPDVALYQARYHGGSWQPGQLLLNTGQVGRLEERYVRRLGNPVIHADVQGRLHLFFVSVAMGGWTGSSLNHMISLDQAHSWLAPRRLVTSPFLNLSTLVRNPPVPLSDGGFMLPVYHEFIRKFPELLRFDADGNLLRGTRMDWHTGSLQPAVVAVSGRGAISYLRTRRFGDNHVMCQVTEDAGLTWTSPAPLHLPNWDSSVTAARLADGRLLMVFNPDRKRFALDLAISADGQEWHTLARLECDPGREYSYPTLLVEGDTIDLCYSWRRDFIKHVRLNQAWIADREKRADGEPLEVVGAEVVPDMATPDTVAVQQCGLTSKLGILGHALLLAWLVMQAGSVLATRKVGQGLAIGLLVMAWLTPLGWCHPLFYTRGLTGDLSVTTQTVLVLAVLRGLGLNNCGKRLTSGTATVLVLAGLTLYAATLGYCSPDMYAWGYQPRGLLVAAAVFSWLAGGTDLAVGFLAAILAFSCHLLPSPNLWDYLLDPVLVIGLTGKLTWRGIRWARRRSQESRRNVLVAKARWAANRVHAREMATCPPGSYSS